MRLTVLTPMTTIVDRTDLFQVAGRDASGAFAIREGHGDFITILEPSVLTLRDHAGRDTYCAVDGGLMRVAHGRITVAAPQAEAGEALDPLVEHIRARAAEETQARAADTAVEHRLQAAVIRHVLESVSDDRGQGGGLRP